MALSSISKIIRRVHFSFKFVVPQGDYHVTPLLILRLYKNTPHTSLLQLTHDGRRYENADDDLNKLK